MLSGILLVIGVVLYSCCILVRVYFNDFVFSDLETVGGPEEEQRWPRTSQTFG